jgi:hypothetical protein
METCKYRGEVKPDEDETGKINTYRVNFLIPGGEKSVTTLLFLFALRCKLTSLPPWINISDIVKIPLLSQFTSLPKVPARSPSPTREVRGAERCCACSLSSSSPHLSAPLDLRLVTRWALVGEKPQDRVNFLVDQGRMEGQ